MRTNLEFVGLSSDYFFFQLLNRDRQVRLGELSRIFWKYPKNYVDQKSKKFENTSRIPSFENTSENLEFISFSSDYFFFQLLNGEK